jgi:hypothetical protein
MLRLQALPPTAVKVQNPAAVEGHRSIGLLHAEVVEVVMRMAPEEIASLLKAANEEDERVRTVKHELAAPFWVIVASIAAWPFLAIAMVLSRTPPPPHLLFLPISCSYLIVQRSTPAHVCSSFSVCCLMLPAYDLAGLNGDWRRSGCAVVLSILLQPPLLPKMVPTLL